MNNLVGQLRKIKDGVLEVFMPTFCVGCGKEGKYICEDCKIFLSENSFICPVCQKANFSGERHSYCSEKKGLDGLISIWDYEGVVKKALLKIKYEGVTHILEELMDISLAVIARDVLRADSFFSFVKQSPTITFVPISKRKEIKRGFNQAELISRRLGRSMNIETTPLLKKTRETRSQTELDLKERMENVKNSFGLAEGSLPESVLLVDDIWTTGATVKECCRVLKEGGTKGVWGFTIARTV